jgi:hypothetical protein
LFVGGEIRFPLARIAPFPARARPTHPPTRSDNQTVIASGPSEGRGRKTRKEAGSVPGPGGALGDEVVAGEDELGEGEDALLEERRHGARARDPLHRALVELVQLLLRLHGARPVAYFPPETKGKAEG